MDINDMDSFKKVYGKIIIRTLPDIEDRVSLFRGFPLFSKIHPKLLEYICKVFDYSEEIEEGSKARCILRKPPEPLTAEIVRRSQELIAEDYNYHSITEGQISPDEVFTTKRAADGVVASLCFMAERIKGMGETPKVLLVEPAYGLFRKTLEELEIEIVTTEALTHSDSDECIKKKIMDALEDDSINMLVLNSPSNPLGHIFDDRLYSAVRGKMRENEFLHVLSDTVYDRLIPGGGKAPSFYDALPPELRRRSFEVFGTSKNYGTGDPLAIGAILTDPEYVRILEGMTKDGGSLSEILPENSLRHGALEVALKYVSRDEEYWRELDRAYKERIGDVLHIFAEELSDVEGLEIIPPISGYYPVIEFKADNIEMSDINNLIKWKGLKIPAAEKGYGGEDCMRICAGACIISRPFARTHGLTLINRAPQEFHGCDIKPDSHFITEDLKLFRIIAQETKASIETLRGRASRGIHPRDKSQIINLEDGKGMNNYDISP